MSNLVACKHCLAQISDSAYECPKCGGILKVPKRGVVGKLFIYSLILWHLFIAFWLFGASQVVKNAVANCVGPTCEVGSSIGAGIGITVILIIGGIGAGILFFGTILTRPRRK